MLRLLTSVFMTSDLCRCNCVTKYEITWGYISANFVFLFSVFANKIVKKDLV